MRRITRKVRRKRKQIIIISSICLLLCLCVGYAAFGTQLSIRAKGNIKEKPHCMLGGIKVNTVTEGDGLYEDIYEEGKCTYKGANPNNYIKFNNETWRILSVECDGRIKIVTSDDIEVTVLWATNLNNNWAFPANLNTYLNESYYLTNEAKGQIVTSNFSIGSVVNDNNDMASQVSNENSKKWSGKIALPTVSEYIRTNSNQSSCGTLQSFNYNYISCSSTEWMYSNSNWWTLSSVSGSTENVYYLRATGRLLTTSVGYTGNSSKPTLYLSSDIQITGGDGSQSNPYTISL